MDKKAVTDILKSEGLEVAEELAVTSVRAAIKLLSELLPKLSNGFGTAFVLFMKAYEPELMKLLDKIDGKDNPAY